MMSVVVTIPMTRSSSSTMGIACTPDPMIRLATSSRLVDGRRLVTGALHELLDAETRIEEGRAVTRASRREELHLDEVGGTQHPDQAAVANDGQVMDRILQETVERFADGTVDFDHDHRLGHDPRYGFLGSHGRRVLRYKDNAERFFNIATGAAVPTGAAANVT